MLPEQINCQVQFTLHFNQDGGSQDNEIKAAQNFAVPSCPTWLELAWRRMSETLKVEL